MKSTVLTLIFGFAASTSMVSAQPVRWTTYSIPQTGTSVDFPASIFTEDAGRPDGYGQRFQTADGRADLTVQATPNVLNDSPAAFLAKKASAAAHSIQAGDISLFRGVKLQGRQGLVRSLQLLEGIDSLRPDQLPGEGRALLGRHRYTHQSLAQRKVSRAHPPGAFQERS